MPFDRPLRQPVAVLIVAAALASPLPARAGDFVGWSVYGGAGASNAGVFTAGKIDGAVANLEVRAPEIEALSWLGSPRPTVGVDIATGRDQISDAYAGLTFGLFDYGSLSFEGQLGAAIHNADLHGDPSGRELGCRALFHLGLDVDWRLTENLSAQLYASHISNANLCDHNAGYETAGLRLGYHF